MRALAVFVVVLACAACRATDELEASFEASSVELFNGRDLAGWRQVGDAKWTIDDGCILGAIGGGHQSFLVTERTFKNFTLEVDLKNELSGNSGIQLRSHQKQNGQVFGYQIEIDPSARAWSGGLYDEGRRGWLQDLAKDPAARAAFKPGAWNHFKIECLGARIRSWVNGVACTDFVDAMDKDGFIGLQVHGGNDTRVRWRNFALVEH